MQRAQIGELDEEGTILLRSEFQNMEHISALETSTVVVIQHLNTPDADLKYGNVGQCDTVCRLLEPRKRPDSKVAYGLQRRDAHLSLRS